MYRASNLNTSMIFPKWHFSVSSQCFATDANRAKRTMLILTLLLTVFVSCFSLKSFAETHDEPKIDKAFEAWLADDDEMAVPIFADLAAHGNEDAMLFLGQIDNRLGLLSPYLKLMPLKERRKLMRAPGGLSGKSWLTKVEKKKDIADALYAIQGGQVLDQGHLQALLENKERQQLIYAILMRGNVELFRLLSLMYFSKQIPQELHYKALVSANSVKLYSESTFWERTVAASLIAELKNGSKLSDLQFHLSSAKRSTLQEAIGIALHRGVIYPELWEPKRWSAIYPTKDPHFEYRIQARESAEDILFNAREAKPVKQVCEKQCPSTVKACMATVHSALGGYENLQKIQTPLDSLISSDRYFDSQRYIADLARNARAVGLQNNKLTLLRHLQKTRGLQADSCALDMIDSYRQ